jgi:Lhr-like helicase
MRRAGARHPRGELDRIELPRNALDILAQQIVAAAPARISARTICSQ